MKWLLLIFAMFAIGMLSYFVMRGPNIDNRGWPSVNDASVQAYPLQQTAGATVENGDAFDKASIDVAPYKKIVVPENADVRAEGKEPRLKIYMKKTLGFGGHPPEPMSIHTARKEMGCAVQVDGTALVLATFGEWSSKEGGAGMHLLLIIPEGLEVEKRADLSRESSVRDESKGWKAVPDVADPERRAQE